MRYVVAALSLGVLAGCGTTPQEAHQKAAGAQDWELCYFNATGRGPANLRQEVLYQLDIRRVDCNQHAAMMQARAAAEGASIDRSLQLIQLGTSIMAPPPPRQTICNSVMVGNTMQTICR